MPTLTGSVLLNALLAGYQPIHAGWLPSHPAILYVIGLILLFGGVLCIFILTAELVAHDVHDVELHKAYRRTHERTNPQSTKHAA